MTSSIRFIYLLGWIVFLFSISEAGEDEISGICKELSLDDSCESLQKAANVLKLKGKDAKEFIKEVSRKGIRSQEDANKFIKDRLNTELSKSSCKDVLHHGHCRKIKEMADEMKAAEGKVKETIKAAAQDGTSHVKKVYDKTVGKLNDAVDTNTVIASGVSYLESNKTFNLRIGKEDLMSLENILLNVFDKATSIFQTAIGKLLELTNEKMLKLKRKVQLIIEQQMKENNQNQPSHASIEYSTSASDGIENYDVIMDEFSDNADGILQYIGFDIRDLINEDAIEDRRRKNKVILETVVEHLTKAFQEVAGKSGRIIKDIRNTMKKTGNKMIDISKIVFDNVVEIVEQLKRKGVFKKRKRMLDRSRSIEVTGKLFPSRKGWEPSGSSIDWNPSDKSKRSNRRKDWSSRDKSSRDSRNRDAGRSRSSDGSDRSYPRDDWDSLRERDYDQDNERSYLF